MVDDDIIDEWLILEDGLAMEQVKRVDDGP